MQVLFAFQFDAELHFPQYTYELKGTRIQIWKYYSISKKQRKEYPEHLAFLILKIIEEST